METRQEQEARAPFKLWKPRRVLVTPDAAELPYGQEIVQNVQGQQIAVEYLKANRITGLRGVDEKETYRLAKTTMALVRAPASALRLQPIPPSADYQFHLAEGCPAHCQYCYLAGSLAGPPVIRVFANLPEILNNLRNYLTPGRITTFEASCYTDPLSLEHLTGGLSRTIRFFAARDDWQLRFVTKFDAVAPLLDIEHNGNTRCRVSLNAMPISKRMEGGTPGIEARIAALRKLAMPRSKGGAGYKVGVIIAPIMPIPEWKLHYGELLDQLREALDFEVDLVFELITHRFTPGSKEILLQWYPNTVLDMDEANRAVKRNKFGGKKYIFLPDVMKSLRTWFEEQIGNKFPGCSIMYYT